MDETLNGGTLASSTPGDPSIPVGAVPNRGPRLTMTLEEAKAVIDQALNRGAYVDIDDPGLATLDGRFTTEVLEAILVVMRAGQSAPIRWSGDSTE